MKRISIKIISLLIFVTIMLTIAPNSYAAAQTSEKHEFTALFQTGDSDTDGIVNIIDATVLQYNLSNMRTTFDDAVIENVGDVDRNDDLDITDVTWIQRTIAGIEVPNYVKVGEYASEVTLPENDTLTQPNLTANVNGNDVDLSWNKVKGANNYRVFTKSHDKWQHLADTSANNCKYTPEDINEGGSFAVCCLNDTRNEYTSSIAQTQIGAGYNHSALTLEFLHTSDWETFDSVEGKDFAVARHVERRIAGHWFEADGISKYLFERTNDADNTVYTDINEYDAYLTDTYNLIDGVTYTYRVWGLDNRENKITPASEPVSLTYHEYVDPGYNHPRAKDIPLEDFEPYEEELEAIELINQFRVENGRKPLVYHKELTRMCRMKAEDMEDNDYSGHTNKDGEDVFCYYYAEKQSPELGLLGVENIAFTSPFAEVAVYGWIGSQHGHRAGLLAQNVEFIGVGYNYNTGTWVYMALHDNRVDYEYVIEATPINP